jgi:hypothetical protein
LTGKCSVCCLDDRELHPVFYEYEDIKICRKCLEEFRSDNSCARHFANVYAAKRDGKFHIFGGVDYEGTWFAGSFDSVRECLASLGDHDDYIEVYVVIDGDMMMIEAIESSR